EGGLLSVRQLVIKARGDMASRLGARLNHLESLLRYQQGRVGDGDKALAAAMEFQRRGSLWLHHIVAAESLAYKRGLFGRRNKLDLYEKVLREPSRQDWQLDPLESLSLTMFMRGGDGLAMERWFMLAKETDRAGGGLPPPEIADLARRYRFT